MRAIVNEASGERAMQHVLELVPYPRIRPVSEYTGHFVAIRHQTNVERAVMRSANVLFDSRTEAQQTLQAFDPLIERRGAALLDEVKAAYALQAAQRHVDSRFSVRRIRSDSDRRGDALPARARAGRRHPARAAALTED
jgi:hypothetical protein